MTGAKRITAVLGLVACIFVPSIALCGGAGDIAFRGEIPVPTSGDRLDLFITLFTLERQNDGKFVFKDSEVQSQSMQLVPRETSLNNSFDFNLDPAADSYQFTVEVLDMSGNITGSYLFNYDDLKGEWDQHMVSITAKNKLPFNFRLATKGEAKTNRLDMMENKDGGYDFYLYHWIDTRVE